MFNLPILERGAQRHCRLKKAAARERRQSAPQGRSGGTESARSAAVPLGGGGSGDVERCWTSGSRFCGRVGGGGGKGGILGFFYVGGGAGPGAPPLDPHFMGPKRANPFFVFFERGGGFGSNFQRKG